MKGITLCADCAYYSMKKHRCIRGATDDSDPRESFFGDCPLDDVAPVVHGRWIEKKLDDFRKWELRCSECGWVGISNYDAYDEPFDFNYCPHCGAKMDEERNE